jgi:acyl carrier protein
MQEAMISNIETFIKQNILRQPNRNIRPDEALLSSGLIDSFSLMDLALFVEDQYNVRIDDTELNADSFDTLAELVSLIAERQS